MANCDYQEIDCVYKDKCKTKLLKKDLAQHLEKECSQRKAECEHCRQELPISELKVRCITVVNKVIIFASFLSQALLLMAVVLLLSL